MNLRQIAAELKRRGVSQVAAIYSAAAWALLQVADVAFPILGFPDETISLVLIAAATGFPFAIALAWIYDLKPDERREEAAATPDVDLSSVPRRRLMEFALVLILVGFVGALYIDRLYLLESQADSSEVASRVQSGEIQNSIAVLPFASFSDNTDDAYFSDGLAEEILNLLSRIRGLDVAARTASFRFRGNDIAFDEIANTLGVTHILEGSVKRDRNHIRITAQLVDAATGYHLWSESYDRMFEDIFGIQDDIARKVATVLQIMLTEDYQPRDAAPTQNMQAYDLYLKGLDYLRRPLGEGVLESAESYFRQAIALDSEFAAAHAGLCNTFIEFYAVSKNPEHFESAEKFCNRTLTLDINTSEAHIALGKLYLHSGQYARAGEEFELSILLDELSMAAYYGLADSLSARNLMPEAEAALRTAIELKPTVWRTYLEMGSFLVNAGRSSEAIPFYQKSIELVPDNTEAYNSLGVAYYMVEDFEAAATAWRHSIALSPSAYAYNNTGSSYYYLGRYDEAVAMYQAALELAPDNYEFWGSLADAQRAAGEEDAALENYQKAMALSLGVLEVNPSDALVTALLAYYQASFGDLEAAPKSADRAEVLAPDDMYVYYFVALTRCRLADHEAALVAVSRMIELGYPRRLLAIEPGLQPLADHPRFRQLLIVDGAK